MSIFDLKGLSSKDSGFTSLRVSSINPPKGAPPPPKLPPTSSGIKSKKQKVKDLLDLQKKNQKALKDLLGG